MPNRTDIMDRFKIVSRANSFLQTVNIPIEISNFKEADGAVKPFPRQYLVPQETCDSNHRITAQQLDKLFNHTIYVSDGLFNLIDYMMDSQISSSIQTWIEEKLSMTADQIEANCKALLLNDQCSDTDLLLFLEKWKRKQPQDKAIDSDSLALRTMETLILLAIVHFNSQFEVDVTHFKQLEEKLMDWSEAVGLIRSLSDERFNIADTSMDIDFDSSITQTSTVLNISQNAFDVYLLEKFKGFKRIKEITEIVAERCGIPLDSDYEQDEKRPNVPPVKPQKEQSKHWRRVKPVTLHVNRVNSAKVNRPSSLSVSEVKANRFLSTSSSSRQVELDVKPPSNQVENNRRRHSEASAPQIIQQTTPTKSKKTSNFTSANISLTNLSDSFVILETPPRALASKQIAQNDLTSSVRRLFPQQPMEE